MQSTAQRSGASEAEGLQQRVLHSHHRSLIHPKGAKGRVPGVIHKRVRVRTPAGLRGHQRNCHGAILPRKESKDILDSGSKSQRANGEQRDIWRIPMSGVLETWLGCVLFGGILPYRGSCLDFSLVMEFAAFHQQPESHFF